MSKHYPIDPEALIDSYEFDRLLWLVLLLIAHGEVER
jgi:hypothetical protein